MRIYKFGGASVKSADGVRNLLKIAQMVDERMVIVVSAMGKMTNALECVVRSFYERKPSLMNDFEAVKTFHQQIIFDLFGEHNEVIDDKYNDLISKLEEIIKGKPSKNYDYEYDRIVPFGELLSTTIVSAYLNECGKTNRFVDIRNCLKTDDNYREGNIDIEFSRKFVTKCFVDEDISCFVTQGFIASSLSGENTTLGREGSDYTAAILANLLNADSVSIWKDVPGVMNADPKRYQDVVIIPRMNYKEAIELSYCGASVIHPKTIKPLQNKQIPLYVKSFLDPEAPGTVINEFNDRIDLPPIYINKTNQVLLTLRPRDFSFIAEERLSKIYAVLAHYRLKVSLVQMSAISFSLCIDFNSVHFNALIDDLKDEYEVLYNTEVELVTIRHYTREIVDKLVGEKIVFIEQRNRSTVRFVLPIN